ncbi:unnamed protein product [Spirodela intermedia]|uniref:Uncharacterized protein n=1 Tax=Spirodela intermedia TaxID=51605 RepID=A0A7I8K5H4_SPIIN|nr:unnamed protein product [Spirodela intermedia]
MKEETRKGPWTEQEDRQLVSSVGLLGDRRWDFVAKVSGLNRTGKSCRLRWVNYLDPCLKRGRMTPQEEYLILELHSRWGNRWSRIARRLPGRTDNEIKNYWRTHMRKKAQQGRTKVASPPQSSASSSSSSWQQSAHPFEAPSENPEPCGAAMVAAVREKRDDGKLEGYPMEQIWDEMVPPAEMTGLSRYEEFCEDEACNISCSPMSSPLWDYSRDTSFGKIDEEFKMFLPFSIPAWSMEENPADTQTLPVHLSPSNASSSTCGRCSIIR